jgi:hypothetical protein
MFSDTQTENHGDESGARVLPCRGSVVEMLAKGPLAPVCLRYS